MTRVRPPTDSRKRNKLILALKSAIEAAFSESDWKELGYQTDMNDYVSGHPRLLRSLSWGDPDYGGHVLDAVEAMLEQDPANLQAIATSAKIATWIKKNKPEVFAEFFGTSSIGKAIEKTKKSAEEFDIAQYIKRIEAALPGDPALAVGSTKELIESVLKTILGMHGAKVSAEDMPKLLKRVQAALGLDPKDVSEDVPGADVLRRLLGSLSLIVVSVTELRNLYGTGHGKSNAPGLDRASAELVVASGVALASYLMDRYKALKGPAAA